MARAFAFRHRAWRRSRPAAATAGACLFNAATAAANAPSHWFAGTLRVLRGSVEVFATKVLRAKPLEVVTPTAVVGVRGTQYRVAFDEDGSGRTHAEVLIEGVVRVRCGQEQAAVPGADLRRWLRRHDRRRPRKIRSSRRCWAGARPFHGCPSASNAARALCGRTSPLRVQVASDAAFDKDRERSADRRRLRGAHRRPRRRAVVSARAPRRRPQGIEGFDAMRPFVLKARPEPPAYRAARASAKQTVGTVEFRLGTQTWFARHARACRSLDARRRVHRRIVTDQDARRPAADAAHRPRQARFLLLAPGQRAPRAATTARSATRNPASSCGRRPSPRFVSRALGRRRRRAGLQVERPPRVDKQQVEFARDRMNSRRSSRRPRSAARSGSCPMPTSSGRYYFRYRSVEPDGFVSPYSETLMVDVPRDWRGSRPVAATAPSALIRSGRSSARKRRFTS